MAKGKRAEYHTRDMLRGFGYSAERNPMSGAISWLKGDIRTNLPFFIEVKNTEKTQFAEWYHKAEQQSSAYPPMIVWTRNQEDMFCFLRFSDFLMALNGKSSQIIKKPEKPQKMGLEETSKLRFSKLSQVHRKKKG